MDNGFTLIEVLLAVFLITIGMAGVFGLVWQTTSFTESSFSEFTAAYLVQEGFEIVRNIRDSNWLAQREDSDLAWSNGLTDCEAGCEGDYTSTSLEEYQNRYLKLKNGFYVYTPASKPETKFKRKITVEENVQNSDILEITVEVSWRQRGRDKSISAQENLYNWR